MINLQRRDENHNLMSFRLRSRERYVFPHSKGHFRHRMTQMQGYVVHTHILKTQSKTLLQLQSSKKCDSSWFSVLKISQLRLVGSAVICYSFPRFSGNTEWEKPVSQQSTRAFEDNHCPRDFMSVEPHQPNPNKKDTPARKMGGTRDCAGCKDNPDRCSDTTRGKKNNKVSKSRQLGKIKI